MFPSQHIILGGIFSIILFVIFPQIGFLGASIIFLSSVLIDVDHYIYYVYVKKDWNLFRAHKWFIEMAPKIKATPVEKRREYYYGLYIFHGAELLIMIIIFSLISYKLSLFLFLGFSFHLSLDLIHELKAKRGFYKVSFLYNFFKFSKKPFIENA